jgi:hypothetical protein
LTVVTWRGLTFTRPTPEEPEYFRARGPHGELWEVEPSRGEGVYLAAAVFETGIYQGRGADHMEALEDAHRCAVERHRTRLATLEGMPE